MVKVVKGQVRMMILFKESRNMISNAFIYIVAHSRCFRMLG
jgi:hypothetical protein